MKETLHNFSKELNRLEKTEGVSGRSYSKDSDGTSWSTNY